MPGRPFSGSAAAKTTSRCPMLPISPLWMFDVGCWLLDVVPSPVPAPRREFSWFFPARAYPLLRHMAVESKPLFHPEVLRQQARSFSLPEQTATWQPKLQHWAELIISGRADAFKETTLLPDFLTDIFCSLLGYTGPAEAADTYTLSPGTPCRGGRRVRRCRPGALPGRQRAVCHGPRRQGHPRSAGPPVRRAA